MGKYCLTLSDVNHGEDLPVVEEGNTWED